jgi:hypothetical protein
MAALQNEMGNLLRALPDLSTLRKQPDTPKGLAEAIESFSDLSVSALKHFAVGLENDARRQSNDRAVNWQTFEHTLTLMKFKDTVDTLREWIGGRLSKDLAMGDNVSPEKYFDAVTELIAEVDKVSPVKRAKLGDTLVLAERWIPQMATGSPEARDKGLGVFQVGTELLKSLGSKLVSPDANPFDKRKTAWETMVYLEGLTDVIGEKRRGPHINPGGHQLERYYEQRVGDFEKRADKAVRDIERDGREERWRREKK